MLSVQNYLLKDLFTTWFGGLLALLFMAILLNALTFTDKIVLDNWSFGAVAKMVALGIPTAITAVLPGTLFMAILVVYWRKLKDSELTVMRASGVSSFHLAFPACLLGVFAVLLSMVLGWYVSIEANRAFRTAKYDIARSALSTALPIKTFISPMEGITFYAFDRGIDNKYRGVMIDDRRNPLERTTITAQESEIYGVDAGLEISLYNATRYTKAQDADFVDSVSFDFYKFETILPFTQTQVVFKKPRDLYTDQLLQRAKQKPQSDYEAAFYERILSPLRLVGTTFLALYLVLGYVVGRNFNAQRLAWGTGIFISTEIVAVILNAMATLLVPVWILPCLAVLILPLGLGVYIVLNQRAVNYKTGNPRTRRFYSFFKLGRA